LNRNYVYNSQGCTKSYHSNEKPPEAERPPVNESNSAEVIEYKTPQAPVFEPLERPPFESPLVSVKNVKDEGFIASPVLTNMLLRSLF
jgi:cysteine/histidine-rich domain-containing protein